MLLPMPLLRMREAAFARGGLCAGPVSLDLNEGERAGRTCDSPQEASIVAMMATGVVKASSGCVLIGDFDPRVQSVACKRLAALVPHEPLAMTAAEFQRYVVYRAALWNVEPSRALVHAQLLQRRLHGMHEAFAYPLIAALIVAPKLLVLDRPQVVYSREILQAAGGRAVFSTHTDAAAARAFTPPGAGFFEERA